MLLTVRRERLIVRSRVITSQVRTTRKNTEDKVDEMGHKINADRVIEQLQCAVASKKSGSKRSLYSGKRHDGCEGHGCSAACGYHGYCDYEATRYYSSRKGQAESANRKEARHTYYRREMRLGYDNKNS